MAQEPTKITARNSDIARALRALETLAKTHGFPDAGTVSRVGRTLRRLREAAEPVGEAQQALNNAYCERDEEGKPIPGLEPGSFKIADMRAFLAESAKLAKEPCEVEVFPITVAALGEGDKTGKQQTCTKCRKVTGLPSPEEYATLLDLGILLERKAESDAA